MCHGFIWFRNYTENLNLWILRRFVRLMRQESVNQTTE